VFKVDFPNLDFSALKSIPESISSSPLNGCEPVSPLTFCYFLMHFLYRIYGHTKNKSIPATITIGDLDETLISAPWFAYPAK
jgi:hypothetical protein